MLTFKCESRRAKRCTKASSEQVVKFITFAMNFAPEQVNSGSLFIITLLMAGSRASNSPSVGSLQ